MTHTKYVFKKKLCLFLVSLIDFVGGIVNFPFKIFKRKTPPNVGKILLIRLDHIGDVVFSTAIPKNLKEHYKDAKVTFLVANWAKEIVINSPYIDEVICYDAPWFDRNRKKRFDIVTFFKLAHELRRHSYDLGFDLRGDFRHILLMALAGIKFRVGYGITGGGFLLHKLVDYKNGVHSIEHNLDLLRDMGIEIISDKPQLYNSTEDEEVADDFFEKNNLSKDNFTVIIHPYAGYLSKNWLDGRFSELVGELSKTYKAKTVFVGSAENKDDINTIIRLSKTPAVNAAGKTTLGGLLALIKRASLFIGIDSGPSHIAVSAGIPTVVLYSGTNSVGEWGPVSSNVSVIQKDIHCKGCQKLDCTDNVCMDLISVDDVLETVKKIAKL